jgi:DNA-binding IscR family transcriptional regulator
LCKLKTVLQEATERYLEVLDGVTIADLMVSPQRLAELPLKRMPLKSKVSQAA